MRRLCRIDIKGSKEIDGKIMKFIEDLKKKIKIKKIILYGSYARRDFNEGSDIDTIIIGNFKEKFKDRIGKILELTNLPIEPLCYTEKEFNKMIANRNPFILSVINDTKNIFFSYEKEKQ